MAMNMVSVLATRDQIISNHKIKLGIVMNRMIRVICKTIEGFSKILMIKSVKHLNKRVQDHLNLLRKPKPVQFPPQNLGNKVQMIFIVCLLAK